MKKLSRIILFLLVAALLLTGLVSCTIPGFGTATPDDGKHTVYSSDTPVTVVTSVGATDAVKILSEQIIDAIENKGADVGKASDAQTVSGSAIYVGETSSDATKFAKSELSKLLSADEVGYIICETDGALAIYSNDETVLSMAVDYFMKNHVTSSKLILDDGFVKSYKMTLEELDEMKADIEWEKRWDSTELKIGTEATAALKALYDFYGDSVYKWIANLYGNDVGGFYYANSARDTEGFLPDIESTTQALWLITATGLTKEFNDDLTKALPKSVVDQTLAFVYGLYDDSDGYFYHPQWGKNIGSSRKGRDINSALGVITKLGGTVPENHALNRLESGVKPTVARLVEQNAVKPASFLSSEAELLKWLEKLNIENDSHSAGHTIESSASQIRAAGYSEFVLNWLDSKQLETGLWQEVDPKNPYMALSGLLKIGSCYKNFGGQMKYCENMIDTAIDVILSDVDPYIVIYVYNPWGGLKYALDNMLSANEVKPGTYDYDSEYQKVIDRLPEMIDVTINKLSKFQKADGSFSYYQTVSAAYTQGTLVSLGKEEGDVNGTSLGMTTMFTTVFEILRLPVVRMYNYDDYETFIGILNNLDPIVKAPKPDFATIDFENEEIPVYISTYSTNGSSTIEITECATNDDSSNKALHILSPAGTGDQITFKSDGSSDGMMMYSFDFDMMIMKGSGYSHQISMLAPNGNITAMMTVGVSGNKIVFGDTSSASHQANAVKFTETANVGEWFHVRMEYHVLEDSTIRLRLYVNDEYAGDSDTFFGKYTSSGAINPNISPTLAVERLQIYSMMSSDGDFYIDNIDYEFNAESAYN